MNYEQLTGWDWSWLLRADPQHAAYCDWNKLDGSSWRWLLYNQPQFADHCDWEKLSGWQWQGLLCDRPEFATHCDWNKLSEYDWIIIFENQPNILNQLPESDKLRAVALNKNALTNIIDPSYNLIRLHRVKHEL